MSEQNTLRLRLLGALIGLVRAAEGNEHLITRQTTRLLYEGLLAADADPETLEQLLARAEEEKRRMVPGCFQCACPCGRTQDYDMTCLTSLPPERRELKQRLLELAAALAAAPETDGRTEQLCRLLYAAGRDDWEKDLLLSIFDTAQAYK